MGNLLVNWLLSSLSLIIVAHLVPGFEVTGLAAALIAPIVIGLVNATVGFLFKILTFPLTLLTLGLFLLVINALMLELAAFFVPGFAVQGFFSAFSGAILLSLVSMVLRFLIRF
ncbi:MAG: phage holin family protein [Deltaproteobacteria bacterium]|nr:phage holin family protein [Deltaproteobacteria bacterium]